MPKPLQLSLTTEERAELRRARDSHEKPYVRERASALLKIAAGWPGRQVALHDLLKPRQSDTVYTWGKRYQAESFSGLFIRPGRGLRFAKTAVHAEDAAAHAELLHLVRRAPPTKQRGA